MDGFDLISFPKKGEKEDFFLILTIFMEKGTKRTGPRADAAGNFPEDGGPFDGNHYGLVGKFFR